MNLEAFILAGGGFAGSFGIWRFLRHREKPVSVSQDAVVAREATGKAESLFVGDVDAPLITITPLVSSTTATAPLPETARLAACLEPLLGRAPELLRLGQEMSTKTLRVVFSPEVTRGLQSGTLVHAQDAARQLLPVARDARTGRFVEVGKTVATGGVRLANVAAASWQIAAIATAQHYLGEINANLQRLEDRVGDIHFFQIEEKRTELNAAIGLLRQYHGAIARGELHAGETAAIYQKLEDLEHTCLGIGKLARRLAEREFEKLDGLEINEYRDPRSSAERAKKWVTQSHDALELVCLAQSCRVLACQVKAALPGDRGLLRQRITEAKDEVRDTVDQLVGMHGRFRKKVVKPLDPKGDLFRSITRYKDYGRKAMRAFAQASEGAVQLGQHFETQSAHALRFAEQFDQLANSGLALEVRFGQNGAIQILSAQST